MEYLCLGIDSVIVSTLYYFYKKKALALANVQNAPEINLNDKNAITDVIEYGMMVGKIRPDNLDLKSHYNLDYSGVIRLLEISEHGTTWRNNISSDTKRIISKVTNEVPFSLVNEKNSIRAQVTQPLKSNYLLDYLEVSHKNFEPIKQSIFTRILNNLTSNETVRGIETTERMLKTGTELTAFGKIEKLTASTSSSWLNMEPDLNYRISEPTGNFTYILTPLSRVALVDKLISTTKTLKIFLAIFGTIGMGIGIYCIYKIGLQYIDKRRREQQIAQARLQRLKNQRQRLQRREFTNILEDSSEQNNLVNRSTRNSVSQGDRIQENQTENAACVICLTNPRELVLLDCGHVCLCMDCFEKMPNSNCPICRNNIRTFLPCYIP